MRDWGTQGRILLDDYFLAVVAVLLLVSIVGAGVAVKAHGGGTGAPTERVVTSWESTAAFSHSATVTEENQVFPVGTTLENRSVYFTRIAPELDGSFTYSFAADDGDLATEISTALVIRSVDAGEEFWRVEDPLDGESTTLSPGETVTTSFALNVTEVMAAVTDIEADLGASPGETEVFVLGTVTVEGTASGESVARTDQYRLPIDPGQNTYEVANSGPRTERHERVEHVSAGGDDGLLQQVLGALAMLVGLGGSGLLVLGRYHGHIHVTEIERRQHVYDTTRSEFDDWISRGTVPEALLARPGIRIDDLAGLVDVAIDTDSRVVEDVDARRYYVVGDECYYEFAPPPDVDL